MLTKQNGDIFQNLPSTNVFLPHITNNAGQWGAGFVVPLTNKWPLTRELYHNHKWAQTLGTVDLIPVESNITVVNMCAQDNITPRTRRLHYGALVICMNYTAQFAIQYGVTDIICPAFGSGIGGGNSEFIDELIHDLWDSFNVKMYVLEK